MSTQPSKISPISWSNDSLVLIDQRKLPQQMENLVCNTLEQAAQAIKDLVVRGAPAIGITAAYAVCLGYRQWLQDSSYDFEQALTLLNDARPTAVNLSWAVQQQRQILDSQCENMPQALLDNAKRIHQQDLDDNMAMGKLGASLIKPGSRVLTHCNAGALATAGYGTALGVIRSAWYEKRLDRVFASETRPWTQGLRLTAWELAEDEIPVSVIIEGAASSLFAQMKIDWVIVGADRICANGDVINKVGTNNLAVMAQHYGVSMMVVAPMTTVDMATENGDQVEIEQRGQDEILGQYYADQGRVDAWNPVFDVTPASLVTAIVTEQGIVMQPDKNKMKGLFLQK
jgi:methylthioribose-1-phosphate isomerase